VLRFGALTHVHTDPGLKIRLPFIDEVILYEKRVLDYDLPPIPVTTVDQKRLVVDTYTRYVIKDPVLFFQSTKPATEVGARLRLETIISSAVRNVLGRIELRKLLSDERSSIMRHIEENVKNVAKGLGIDIIDVRIIRTELPPENRNAVFARMNAELNRIAAENRAKGSEIAQGIRAKAEAEQTVILATAQKEAQTIRGAGEAKAIHITSEAFGKDIGFYTFYRSLQMYDDALTSETSLILSMSNPLLRFLGHPELHKD
jgi:membrane protease subunit HflC